MSDKARRGSEKGSDSASGDREIPGTKTRLKVLSDPGLERPKTREDCLAGGINEQRPCPWVSCKHHTSIDVSPTTGTITFRGMPDELEESCVLDVADKGGFTLEEVGDMLGITRERVRHVEALALAKLSDGGDLQDLETEAFAEAHGMPENPHAEDGTHGAFTLPKRKEPGAALRLMFTKALDKRLRDREFAAWEVACAEAKKSGRPTPPMPKSAKAKEKGDSSSSDDYENASEEASARAMRGKQWSIRQWTPQDQVALERDVARYRLVYPEGYEPKPWNLPPSWKEVFQFDERLMDQHRRALYKDPKPTAEDEEAEILKSDTMLDDLFK